MMKYLILFLLMPILTIAQKDTTAVPKTDLEKISTKTGSIIKRDFQKIDDIRGLEISLLTVTETNSYRITRGAYLSGLAASGLSSSNRYTAYLDQDEITDLIKFVEYIKGISSTPPPKNDQEYIFNCKGDAKLALYNNRGAYGIAWHYLFDFDRRFSGGSIEFKEKDIDKLIDAFKNIAGKFGPSE